MVEGGRGVTDAIVRPFMEPVPLPLCHSGGLWRHPPLLTSQPVPLAKQWTRAQLGAATPQPNLREPLMLISSRPRLSPSMCGGNECWHAVKLPFALAKAQQ